MPTHDSKAIELNEAEWWANWGKISWFGPHCYVLSSTDFKEPFFNRAGLVSCDAGRTLLLKLVSSFGHAKLLPHVTVMESCKQANTMLTQDGFSLVDEMIVQRVGNRKISASRRVAVREARHKDLEQWCETYLLSFYGDLALKSKVMKVVRKLSRLERVSLLVAELDGSIVGVTALYKSPGLLGLYCLGTLASFRGRGVARTLLSAAQERALSEERLLILQSLSSEDTEPYYGKFGFRRLYVKKLLRGKPSSDEIQEASLAHSLLGTVLMRDPGAGDHLFNEVFKGFEKVEAVQRIFGEGTGKVLSGLPVEVIEDEGYMHINTKKGAIVVSASYLKQGNERYLYLDAIHELVHIRQHMEGKQLWDRRYKYVDRPTELEAYKVAVDEARRIGFVERELIEYLRVEWVGDEDFRRFLATLGVNKK